MRCLVLFFSALVSSPAFSDVSCVLSTEHYGLFAGTEKDELLIRIEQFQTEAVLITSLSGAKVFTCGEAIIDEFECYGVTAKPFETPTQLNVIGDGIQAGTIVTYSALNLNFIRQYASSGYASADLETRRFSTDVYVIESCQ